MGRLIIRFIFPSSEGLGVGLGVKENHPPLAPPGRGTKMTEVVENIKLPQA
jgi:hypothetical protein